MPLSINSMIREMHSVRHDIEDIIDGESAELRGIFDKAEVELFKQRRLFYSMDIQNGMYVRSKRNIELAEEVLFKMRKEVGDWVLRPGRQYIDRMVPRLAKMGERLARTNFDVEFLSPEIIRETFAHVPRTMGTVLEVGRKEGYQIMGTVGEDINNWFRNELLDAVVEGKPVQGAGSLAQALYQSGRLRPIVIRTQKGGLIRRSIKQRADTIARVESNKIINRVHQELAQKALGKEAVYLNSNPRDSRTTDICARASREEPKTLQQWTASQFGRPPRLVPFHICRSFLIGGKAEWFEDNQPPTPATPPKKPAPKGLRERQAFLDAKAELGKIQSVANASDHPGGYDGWRKDVAVAKEKVADAGRKMFDAGFRYEPMGVLKKLRDSGDDWQWYLKNDNDAVRAAGGKETITQRDAVISYTGAMSASIRRYLAGQINPDLVEPGLADRAKQFIKAADKAPKFKGVVYRGMRFSTAAELSSFVDGIVKTKMMELNTVQSFSRSKTIASKFAGGSSIMIRARTKSGRSIEWASIHQEKEVVMMPGTKYKYVKHETRESMFGETHIDLEIEEI